MSIAIVTGGSRGIGAAIARRLAKEGHDIVVNCASSVEKAEAVAAECRAMGVNAVAMQWDVSDHAACEQALAEIKEKMGVPYILVNNAGITRDGLMVRMQEAQFDEVININLKGAFNMLQLCGDDDDARKEGTHHQYYLDFGSCRKCRTGQLLRSEGGHDRYDQNRSERARCARHYRQCGCAGLD